MEAIQRKSSQSKLEAHCHHLTWSRDGRYVYFVRGLPLERTDIWRIASTGGEPERITRHNSMVAYPAFMDNQTLLYTATAEDGSGPWLFGMDLEGPCFATIKHWS